MSAPTRTARTPWLFFFVFYAFLANIPFWYAKHLLGFFHDGWFCIEYAVVGLLALFVPRLVASALLFITIVADMICAVCETYFLTPMECLTNLEDLGKVDARRLVVLLGLYALTFAVIATPFVLPLIKLRGKARSNIAACLVAFVVICTATDLVTLVRRDGHIPNPLKVTPPIDGRKLSAFDELRLTRRTVVRLISLTYYDAAVEKLESDYNASNAKVPSASSIGLQQEGASPIKGTEATPNIVLVLLESWGQAKDAAVRDALVQPYARPDLLARYKVSQGTVPFYGPTMGGEGRELCSSRIGFKLMTATAEALESCLPDKLRAEGYGTIGVHGLDGHVFKRADWWARIGFKQEIFHDGFTKLGLPTCEGAFPGTCDAAIAEWIGRRLQAPEPNPEFLYWVTLNSHLPVPVPSPLQNGATCAIDTLLTQKPAVCSWYQLVANVHASVAQLAMTKSDRPTMFIIVGDHAPPFADTESRSAFLSASVPYIILTPQSPKQASPAGD